MTELDIHPTTDRADDALAATLETAPGGLAGAFGTRAITFREFERFVSRVPASTRRALTPIARALLLDRLLGSVDPGPFRAVAGKPGFRKAVDGFLRDLALGQALPRELAAVAARLGGAVGARIEALARIAEAFFAELDRTGLEDPADALAAGCRALEEGAPLPVDLAGADVLRVHDIVDWPPSRLAVLRAVGAACERAGSRIEVVLPRSSRPELADVLEPSWQALESIPVGVDIASRPLREPSPGHVVAIDTASEETEAREVARRVKALLDAGTAPQDVVVAAREMDSLVAGLARKFAEVGVPVRHRRGRSAADSVVAKVALELCRFSQPEDVSRERLASLVGSLAIDLRGLHEEAPPPSKIVRHLDEARVRDRTDEDGSDGVLRRLERLARATEHESDAADVRRTSETLARLFARLDAWPARAPVRRHGRQLLGLLDAMRVPNRLRRLVFSPDATAEEAELQAAGLAHEQSSWTKLTAAVATLEEAARTCGTADVALSRSEYASWLETVLTGDYVRPGSARGVAVELVELADVAGRRITHLFLVGAHEARLPGPPDRDPLFSDDERWRMNHALGRPVFRVPPRGMDRSPLPSRQLLHGLSFALALDAADHVTISRPRSDARGRPLAASPFLALCPAATTESIRFEPLDPRHRVARPDLAEVAAAQREREAFFDAQVSSAFAGSLASECERLLPHLPGSKERPWSASALERAANCRFRYFAENVLGAAAPSDADEDAGALETGRVAHLAAEEAVRAILDQGLWDLHRTDEAIAVGVAAARRAVAAEEQRMVVGDPTVWAIRREKMFGRLARLLGLEIRRAAELDMTPTGLELAFGRDALLPAVRIGGLHVAGKIDRVDRGSLGTLVLDYKSGTNDANLRKLRPDALLVTQFQLPLYMLAARQLLGAGEAVDAAYVSLRDGERSKTLLGTAKTDAAEVENALAAAVTTLADRLAKGDFAPTPASCTGCHVRPICRIPQPEAGR